jgi:hypothetical protein
MLRIAEAIRPLPASVERCPQDSRVPIQLKAIMVQRDAALAAYFALM